LQQQPALTAEDYAFSRLISYAAYQWPGYRDAAHHRLIARHLEAVERGDITRLMITMPPRHGKSMLASEFFPAWYLGRNPDHYVVTATYAQELADDFGRKVKNQIEDPLYQAIFPGVGLADDSKSAKRFHIDGAIGGYEHAISQRGAFYAVGVGGPLTGRGAHLLLIDDPVKNREDAESEVIRRKVKDWYTSTAYTRLMPGGRIVVIQTRWHEDDLTGWLQLEHEHEGWTVLNLPAIDDDGEALWPEQYDIETLEKIRRPSGRVTGQHSISNAPARIQAIISSAIGSRRSTSPHRAQRSTFTGHQITQLHQTAATGRFMSSLVLTQMAGCTCWICGGVKHRQTYGWMPFVIWLPSGVLSDGLKKRGRSAAAWGHSSSAG
jgi:hypothetical protein